MTALAFLIPAALFLGLLGLGAFFWTMRSGQFDDLDGAAMRILLDDPTAATKPGDEQPESVQTRKGSP
jgi:cbb3-type cytochrome oxidase maturation protein